MTAKFNANACYSQIQSINEQIKKLNEEILPLRRKVLWGGTKEEKESISPYLNSLEGDLKELKAQGVYWEKLFAAISISRSRKAAYKYYTAVIHSRKMLNKIAVYTQSVFNYPYKNMEMENGWNPGYEDLKAARYSTNPVYKDPEGKPLIDFFTKQQWKRLDKLNQDVNDEAHDDDIPTDPIAPNALFRIVVPDKHYVPGLYEEILLRCKVGNKKEDFEIQKASEESPGSDSGGSPQETHFPNQLL
ncbi:hypothetical protein MP228_011123 [Amoeboaphelidium protococcarum]|nr:hypothetical protein MP228_011123 [Amoeboaphelidium protococcarum]